MSTIYEQINYMEDWTLIAGSSWVISFTTFEEDGVTPQNMTGGTASYRIAPLGDADNTIIELIGTFTSELLGEWNVTLESSDTSGLSGVFVGQPRLVDFGGDVFIVGQGRITIISENQ